MGTINVSFDPKRQRIVLEILLDDGSGVRFGFDLRRVEEVAKSVKAQLQMPLAGDLLRKALESMGWEVEVVERGGQA